MLAYNFSLDLQKKNLICNEKQNSIQKIAITKEIKKN